MALGLAITFGLMGIINMAHGEMIAVGAYTCYVVQNVFGTGFGFSITLPFSCTARPMSFGLHLPGLNASGWVYESYFLLALPLSFRVAAPGGSDHRTQRHPLSLSPSVGIAAGDVGDFARDAAMFSDGLWGEQCSGQFAVMAAGPFLRRTMCSFGYNRVFVIAFACLIVVGTWLLAHQNALSVFSIRAVMQNRGMAACMGVRTAPCQHADFRLRLGLAGLAGAFLSQIGNVGPSLGQTYIVDSFMTVVVGGVGSIVGTIWSALGIGTADQVLQQVTGSPVTGKIVVLARHHCFPPMETRRLVCHPQPESGLMTPRTTLPPVPALDLRTGRKTTEVQSPKGSNSSAQGNALGNDVQSGIQSPERAKHYGRLTPAGSVALSGLEMILYAEHPGRCPGLTSGCAFGAVNAINPHYLPGRYSAIEEFFAGNRQAKAPSRPAAFGVRFQREMLNGRPRPGAPLRCAPFYYGLVLRTGILQA